MSLVYRRLNAAWECLYQHLEWCPLLCYLFQQPHPVLSLSIKVILHHYCGFLIFFLFCSKFSHDFWCNSHGQASLKTAHPQRDKIISPLCIPSPMQKEPSFSLSSQNFHSALILFSTLCDFESSWLNLLLQAIRKKGTTRWGIFLMTYFCSEK